jgi:hypothetical protein
MDQGNLPDEASPRRAENFATKHHGAAPFERRPGAIDFKN